MWDYHVVLVLRPLLDAARDDTDDGENSHTGSLIYDFDTTLDLPYDAQGGCSIHKVLSHPLGGIMGRNIVRSCGSISHRLTVSFVIF